MAETPTPELENLKQFKNLRDSKDNQQACLSWIWNELRFDGDNLPRQFEAETEHLIRAFIKKLVADMKGSNPSPPRADFTVITNDQINYTITVQFYHDANVIATRNYTASFNQNNELVIDSSNYTFS